MATTQPIPTVLRIDIEPDEHRAKFRERWPGFVNMVGQVEELRARLSDLTGETVQLTWLVRLDPDIERVFGRADFAVEQHRDLFDRLIGHGDPLGIHVHALRWDAERQVPFSDHRDDAWTTHCLTSSSGAFRECFGEPVRRCSQGGYFLSETLLDAMEQLEIDVDLTVEPGHGPVTSDPSLGAYATAPSGDFRECPRRPYFPSRRSFAVEGRSQDDSRRVLLVPLSSYDYRSLNQPLAQRMADRVLGRTRRHLPLNPWKPWASPGAYWDLVERAADSQPARYVALAVRTDASDSVNYRRVSDLLEHLPLHPIARRLRFLDPLSPEIRALAPPVTGGRSGGTTP